MTDFEPGGGWWALSYRTRERIATAVRYLLVAAVLLIVLFPLFWMFSSALRPNEGMFVRPVRMLPGTLTLENYERIFTGSDFVRYYANSVIVAAGVVALTTVTSTLGGYGLTRIDIPHKRLFARSVLFGYMFPAILLSIPMFILWRNIGIIDTYVGLVLAETALALPFSLWLMWMFFQTVPESLEESARMAGASRFRAFYEIALPMAKPGATAVAVFAYGVSWNAYTIPKIIMPNAENWPLTVGVHTFTQYHEVLWGEVMAASSLIILPGFLFVYFLQSYLLRGFQAGGAS